MSFQDDVIINGRNRHYWCDNRTPDLSIKTMHNGQAIYQIEGGRFAVGDDSYLILNHAQPYIIDISSQTIVESFCIFFPYGWVEDVYHAMTTPDDGLLDRAAPDRNIQFFERLYHHDEVVTPIMRQLQRSVKSRTVDDGTLEEKLRLILARMLHVEVNIYRELELMPAARHATRVELYRRLHRARDYIHASLSQTLTLEQIASFAYLSPYHFLRAFKRVFGQTPHAYLTHKRLERAQFLLTRTDLPVTEICCAVGFESLGSFSSLFHRHTGESPRAYRNRATFEK